MTQHKTGFALLMIVALVITLGMAWVNLRERWGKDSRVLETRAKLAEMEKKGESDPETAFELAKGFAATTRVDKAHHWLRKASELGHLKATLDLAVIAATNHDMPQFHKFLKRASELGDGEAAFSLACEYGRGPFQNDGEALKYLERASQLDFPRAKDLWPIAREKGIDAVRDQLRLE